MFFVARRRLLHFFTYTISTYLRFYCAQTSFQLIHNTSIFPLAYLHTEDALTHVLTKSRRVQQPTCIVIKSDIIQRLMVIKIAASYPIKAIFVIFLLCFAVILTVWRLWDNDDVILFVCWCVSDHFVPFLVFMGTFMILVCAASQRFPMR